MRIPPSNIKVDGIMTPRELSWNFVVALPTASSTSDREYIFAGGYFLSVSVKMERASGTVVFASHRISQIYPQAIKITPSNRVFFLIFISRKESERDRFSLFILSFLGPAL